MIETATILSSSDLEALLDAHPSRESFGPGGEWPMLVFRLKDGKERLAPLLSTLPCVVIGIGKGALADACDVVLETEARLPMVAARITQTPIATMTLVQHLRASATLPLAHALVAESFAYATVQAGPEFRRWQTKRLDKKAVEESGPPLLIDREGDTLRIILNRPETRNAIGIEMRDALCEAFDLAALDPDVRRVVLEGAGRCFSIGGDVREFGLTTDSATAHWIRSVRLPATRLPSIADKLEVRIDGGAVGAGIEIAAFARRIVATSRSWFQLPELDFGLIPGAGGTISIPRRIGRRPAAEIMLTSRRISSAEALRLGLIDAIEG